jgi:hypothetical protein
VAGLWNDAISFGEVVALIFADLLILPILPILNIYEVLRRPDDAGLLGTFYGSMVGAGYLV